MHWRANGGGLHDLWVCDEGVSDGERDVLVVSSQKGHDMVFPKGQLRLTSPWTTRSSARPRPATALTQARCCAAGTTRGLDLKCCSPLLCFLKSIDHCFVLHIFRFQAGEHQQINLKYLS